MGKFEQDPSDGDDGEYQLGLQDQFDLGFGDGYIGAEVRMPNLVIAGIDFNNMDQALARIAHWIQDIVNDEGFNDGEQPFEP
jgi:hypothetical protein